MERWLHERRLFWQRRLDRLGEAKGAVELLLAECYVRRDEVAQAAGTLGYELMCALAPRVPVETILVLLVAVAVTVLVLQAFERRKKQV